MPTPVVLALTKLPCQGTPLLKRHQNLAAKTIGSPKGLSSSRFWRVPASLRARAGLGARARGRERQIVQAEGLRAAQ